MNKHTKLFSLIGLFLGLAINSRASEANLAIPDLHEGTFDIFGGTVSSWDFLFYGAMIIAGTLFFSLFLFVTLYIIPDKNNCQYGGDHQCSYNQYDQ